MCGVIAIVLLVLSTAVSGQINGPFSSDGQQFGGTLVGGSGGSGVAFSAGTSSASAGSFVSVSEEISQASATTDSDGTQVGTELSLTRDEGTSFTPTRSREQITEEELEEYIRNFILNRGEEGFSANLQTTSGEDGGSSSSKVNAKKTGGTIGATAKSSSFTGGSGPSESKASFELEEDGETVAWEEIETNGGSQAPLKKVEPEPTELTDAGDSSEGAPFPSAELQDFAAPSESSEGLDSAETFGEMNLDETSNSTRSSRVSGQSDTAASTRLAQGEVRVNDTDSPEARNSNADGEESVTTPLQGQDPPPAESSTPSRIHEHVIEAIALVIVGNILL